MIDYGRSDMRSDWMDIFLLARSRFVLGSASGPIFVPPLYGVPCVLTNWWPPGMRPWHASDIYIPKLPKRAADAAYLTLSETLREPVSYCHSLRHLAKHEAGRGGGQQSGHHPRCGCRDAVAARRQCGRDADVADLRMRADRIYESRTGISAWPGSRATFSFAIANSSRNSIAQMRA